MTYVPDWQVIVPAITSLSAVIAALLIGYQQVKINRGQLDLQKANLQERLFDRRFQIYRETQDYVIEIIRHEKYPGYDKRIKFWESVDQAKFLFSSAVHSQLVEMLKEADQLDLCEQMLFGEDKLPVGPERTKWAKRKSECVKFFLERSDRLHKIFEADLWIGAPTKAP